MSTDGVHVVEQAVAHHVHLAAARLPRPACRRSGACRPPVGDHPLLDGDGRGDGRGAEAGDGRSRVPAPPATSGLLLGQGVLRQPGERIELADDRDDRLAAADAGENAVGIVRQSPLIRKPAGRGPHEARRRSSLPGSRLRRSPRSPSAGDRMPRTWRRFPSACCRGPPRRGPAPRRRPTRPPSPVPWTPRARPSSSFVPVRKHIDPSLSIAHSRHPRARPPPTRRAALPRRWRPRDLRRRRCGRRPAGRTRR